MRKRLKDILRQSLVLCVAALCIAALAASALRSFPGFSRRLDNFIHDSWMRALPRPAPSGRVAIVDMDDASMRKIGQLPWPRTILADLVDFLLSSGVGAIGLDIWLTEPDRSSPIAVDGLLEKNFGLNLDFSRLPPNVLDNDRYLRDSIAGKPVVLGSYADFSDRGEPPPLMPSPVKITQKPAGAHPAREIAEIAGLAAPVPVLTAAAPAGLLNMTVDDDGIVRAVPLLARSGGEIYPALALRTLMTALGQERLELVGTPGGSLLRLGELEIPIGRDGSFRPIFPGPARSLRYYSAVDILDGRVDPADLEGRIIFIGPSAHTVQNALSTPLDPAVPGMEIHAAIVENILAGRFIAPLAHEPAWQFFSIWLSALLGLAMFRHLGLPLYSLLALCLAGAWVWLSWLLFRQGIFFSPAGPLLALALAALAVLPVRYWREQTDRRKLRQAFSRYVSPEVVSRIVSQGDDLLRGEQKEATVLFTDVRGFTSISERLSPPQLVRLLNCYFTPMTACVTARHGTLDKFIGDALMAFWNAPLEVSGHQREAVLAALEMQAALARLRPGIMEEFGIDLRMGIGINSGLVHVGNMGSSELLDYTCIGENVNLASRLEGMCRRYGVSAVVSASVRNACGQTLPFLALDRIRVKGSCRPLEIFTPLAPDQCPDKSAARWEMALAGYFAGDFADAGKLFGELRACPFLAEGAALFASRCAELVMRPPVSWDGVWTYNEK